MNDFELELFAFISSPFLRTFAAQTTDGLLAKANLAPESHSLILAATMTALDLGIEKLAANAGVAKLAAAHIATPPAASLTSGISNTAEALKPTIAT